MLTGKAAGDVDAVMMLRVQRERMTDSYFPSAREYSRRYGLDRGRMALLPDEAIVMHPGPMNRGMEIALDFALNCSPDHPYVKQHPDWFYRREDGSIAEYTPAAVVIAMQRWFVKGLVDSEK